ncbi:Metallothionein-like protein type 2 [Linum grandiflorum]
MSCCGGNCGCGPNCKCTGCNGCNMYPGLTEAAATATQAVIVGVGSSTMGIESSSEMNFGSENGCKCGANCSCVNCTCNN